MHVGDAAAPPLPQLAQLPQKIGLVEVTGGLIHAKGMKILDRRKFIRPVAVPADHASAIPENTRDAAVFPVSFLVL